MPKDVSWDNGRYSSNVSASGKFGPLQQNRGFGSGKSYKADTDIDVLGFIAIVAIPFILIHEWLENDKKKSKESSDLNALLGTLEFLVAGFISWLTFVLVIMLPISIFVGNSPNAEPLGAFLGMLSIIAGFGGAALWLIHKNKPKKNGFYSRSGHTGLPIDFNINKAYDLPYLRSRNEETLENIFTYSRSVTTRENVHRILYSRRGY